MHDTNSFCNRNCKIRKLIASESLSKKRWVEVLLIVKDARTEHNSKALFRLATITLPYLICSTAPYGAV